MGLTCEFKQETPFLLPNEIYVDNFAGGGGASTGLYQYFGIHPHIGINHDPKAIAMYQTNHPDTEVFCESVWDVDPIKACRGRPVGFAWFSPDCRHFSKAKGSQPVKKEIRGLAWIVLRWAVMVPMRCFALENVEEFTSWGPCIEVSPGVFKPDPERAGETFRGFIRALTTGITPKHPAWKDCVRTMGVEYDIQYKLKLYKGLGYQLDSKIMAACDYGVPTTRQRFYMFGRNDNQPIKWPHVTHGKQPHLQAFKTAADIIDWSIPLTSIFGRKRPLAPKTMMRIAKGIKRYLMESDNPFVVPHDKGAVIAPFITECANGSSQRNMAANEPLRTICAQVKGGHFALVSAMLEEVGEARKEFLDMIDDEYEAIQTSSIIKFRGDNIGHPTDEPLHTISAGGTHLGEVRAFLVKYYGESVGQPVNAPLGTVTTRERFGLVVVRGTLYQIVDIGFRMLQPHELFAAMGFPSDYKISHYFDGTKVTKKDQVARCGNAVCPTMSMLIAQANFSKPHPVNFPKAA